MYIEAAGIAAAVGHYRQCLPDSDFPPKGTPPHYQDTGETVISNLVTWSISRGLAGVKALFNGVDDLDCEEAGILHKRDSPAIKACMLNSAGATVSIPEVPYTVEALGVGTDATGTQTPVRFRPNQCCMEVLEKLWEHKAGSTPQEMFMTQCLLSR